MCSADYPVTAEDAYRTRLKPWERDDAEIVCWDPGPILSARARKRGGANPYLESWKVPLFDVLAETDCLLEYSKNIA